MDANKLWDDIVLELNRHDDLTHDDIQDLEERVDSLRDWLQRGGFVPTVLTDAGLTSDGALALCLALANELNVERLLR